MEDVTIHLRGGQSITVRVKECAYSDDGGKLRKLTIRYGSPEGPGISWLRLDAVDAIESTLVRDPEEDGDDRTAE